MTRHYYRLTNLKIVRAFEIMRKVLDERPSQAGTLASELAPGRPRRRPTEDRRR